MASIELYINRQLCDIENPETFSVYLKRQLFNPAELKSKDAQKSYDITLPATATNNEIFGYINTEEVRGKFSQLYDAQMYVGGVKVFDGKFKLSEVTKDTYKGNLGVPAQKSMKELFGETMMNQAGEWRVPFEDYSWITKYNNGEIEDPHVIFPFVLYKLLPRNADSLNIYKKKIITTDVEFSENDFPPSIKCLEALKYIFASKGFFLNGTAFDDERLKKLYMSYKNPADYTLPWNYGKTAHVQVKGNWINRIPEGTHGNGQIDLSVVKAGTLYNIDLMAAEHSKITVVPENASSLKVKKEPFKQGETPWGTHYNTYKVWIPQTGYYKIAFEAKANVYTEQHWGANYENDDDKDNIVKVISPVSIYEDSVNSKTLTSDVANSHIEVKVLRIPKSDDPKVDLGTVKYDRTFFRNNEFYTEKEFEENQGEFPYSFPDQDGVLFVDCQQNADLLCGISFGDNQNPIYEKLEASNVNEAKRYTNPIAAKSRKSWNRDALPSMLALSAVKNKGYTYQYHLEGDQKVLKPVTGKAMYAVDMQGVDDNASDVYDSGNYKRVRGEGKISQVIWLKEGEVLTVVATSEERTVYRKVIIKDLLHPDKEIISQTSDKGWVYQQIEFDLTVSPFRVEKEWLKINEDTGVCEGAMNWDDDINFLTKEIDLIKFLPSNVKVDDWVDNFCKAFNLDLLQAGNKEFLLNTRQLREHNVGSIIDLDAKTDVDAHRRNSSLLLPSSYDIGFTIDTNEQGYMEKKDTGQEIFFTDSIENKPLQQKSNFSYNWFTEVVDENAQTMALPVISDKEIWESMVSEYPTMKDKNYTDKAQRFWYKRQDANNVYPLPKQIKDFDVSVALVTNQIDGQRPMVLNYKDEDNSILKTYFTLLTDTENSYTTVECFLSPEEYNALPESYVRLNGDLYTVAEIDGYDPMSRKKTTLKLIRKKL